MLIISGNGFALKWLCSLWRTGESFQTTNSVFLCLTLVDLTRGLTDSQFYFLFLYMDHDLLQVQARNHEILVPDWLITSHVI